MRGRRFAGMLAGGTLLFAVGMGPGSYAAEGLPGNPSGGIEDIVPPVVASVLPLPDDVPLPESPATGGGGDPTPVPNSGGSGGSGGAGESGSGGPGGAKSTTGSTGSSAGSASTPAPGSPQAPANGDPSGNAADVSAPTTLTGSAGTLAANIGRLAKPLGIPLGLGFVGAVIFLIAMQRPVALRKVEEEGPWGYEGRSHRL